MNAISDMKMEFGISAATRFQERFMAQIKSLACTLVALLVLVIPLGAAQANSVGRTPGTYSVSPTGAATYSIPIWAPGGPHGVQPHIALAYNSRQGYGDVGVGWGISGLSSIYRCNKTIAQDGVAAPIAFAVSDGYCMDGQRLLLTGGTYGTANSTYETEIANFIHVKAYGASGNGPAYWVATAKNGWTYTYGVGGSTSNAAVAVGGGNNTVVSWQLNEVADTYGNSMTITYSTNNANASVVPNVISWVPATQGSSTYNYTMTFIYTANGSIHGYVGGTAVNNTNLLSSITIAYQNTPVKSYYLTYTTPTATGRNLLTQVSECAGTDTGNCLFPTSAIYQSGAAGVGPGTTLSGTYLAVLSTAHDFNGDGRNDLLLESSTGAVYVALATTAGYESPTPVGIQSTNLMVGDIDASGVDSLVTDVSGTWYYYKWTPSGFQAASTGVSVTATSGSTLADVDGDGRADLIQAQSDGYIHVRLNTSSGGSVTFAPDINTLISLSQGLFSASASNRKSHFWGSNQDDIIEVYDSCLAYTKTICTQYENFHTELDFTGTTFNVVNGYNNTSAAPQTSVGAIDMADYNDDGCTDVLTTTQLLLSACNGNAPVTIPLPSGDTAIGGMDWDGDGRRDVLIAQSNGYVGVLLSTGTGLSTTVINTSVPYATGSRYIGAPNPTGDGQDGLVVSNGSSVTYYLHNSPGAPPDLLTSISDGFNNFANPTYTSLAYGNVYSNDGAGTYPDLNYVGAMYVVQASVFSDPTASGSTYTTTNSYAGALHNVQGRGFDGFNQVTTLDSRNQLQDTSSFNQVFPYTGIKSSEVVTEGSQTISSSLNSLATPLVVLSSGTYPQRYMPYNSSSITKQYEFGGSENDELITTTSVSVALDNYGNPTTITRTVTDNDPGSPTMGQSWKQAITNVPVESTSPIYCANLMSSTQTEYSASVDTPVTVSKSLTPDSTTHCNYTQIVTQPGTSYALTEALGYDSFGNVNSDSFTGTGIGTRGASANWGTTGQYLMSATDPSGATTQLNYDFSYGTLSSQTDPNGAVTSWPNPDGFGRRTQEIRPDQTSTSFSYLDMDNEGYGYHAVLVHAPVYDLNGVQVSDHDTGYDQLDRQVVQVDQNMGGGYNQITTKYDALGRVAAQSAPCTWTAWPTTCTNVTTNTYDILNRLTQSQPTGYGSTTYAYQGRTTVTTDANNHANTTVTGVDGTLRRITDANGYTIIHGYDAAGTRVSTTDNQSRNLWSANSVVYGIAPFTLGTTDFALGSRSYTVDALGEITNYSDSNGNHFSATYDVLGRLTSRTEPDLYTVWTWGSLAGSHNIGKLQSICTGPGTNTTNPPVCTSSGYSESEAYDSEGRLSQRSIVIPTTSVAGGTYTYNYQYNAAGQLSTLTYPATIGTPLQLSYSYDFGTLASVTDISDSPNVTLWASNSRNPAGQVTQETLGNGIQVNRSYDALRMWLNSVTAGVNGSAALENQSYLHDEVGNVTQRQENNLGLTENFYYDNLNRLASSQLATPSATTTNLQMCYDNAGGGCAANVAGPGMITGKIGDTINRGSYTATWTSYNYLASLSAGPESVQFQYGPDRSRWQQVYTNNNTGTETTNYIGGSLEQVVSSGVTTYRAYVYAGKEPVAIQSRTSGANAWSYMLSDHQGSVASLMDSSGNNTVSESFTAYGVRRNPQTWSGTASSADLGASANITRQGYTFQTALGEATGFNHMNGRVQDAMTGQFLSPDPTIPDPTNTQSYYRYSYTVNNPVSRIDPTGFEDDPDDSGDGGGGSGGDSSGIFASTSGGGVPSNGQGRGGISGLPEQSSWDCYGNCGPGYSNSPSGNWLYVDGTWVNTGSLKLGLVGTNVAADSQNSSKNVFVGVFNGTQSNANFLGEFVNGEWRAAGSDLSEIGGGATSGSGYNFGIDMYNTIVGDLEWFKVGVLLAPVLDAGAGAIASVPRVIAGIRGILSLGAEEAGGDGAAFSGYDSTKGLKGLNTNITADEFSANLQANGYTATQTTGTNGAVTILQNGEGSTWTIYTRSSTGDMGAQYVGPNGQFLKYNLGVPDLPLPPP